MAEPRATFRAAYRLARLAFRGHREALKLDLQTPPDYSPACRRCNARVAVTRKVAAAIGYADQLALCIYSQAVRIALGETPQRQPGMPASLDFEGWAAWRPWCAGVREAA